MQLFAGFKLIFWQPSFLIQKDVGRQDSYYGRAELN